MVSSGFPARMEGSHIHLVGAKGTGMAALAEILSAKGAVLTGSDVVDVFYTDAILKDCGVRMHEGFDPSHLGAETGLVIHSAAYSRSSNPELVLAAERGLPILSYPEALGRLSLGRDSTAIAGVHGKTTTTAMAGSIVAALGLDATVLAGSAVSSFGGHSTLIRGDRFFIAETCEYRRHFLNFHPNRMVVTSIEPDHQDYYPGFEDILAAFVEFGQLLPVGGSFIYCHDDPGACEAASRLGALRSDIRMIPYGFTAPGPYRMTEYRASAGRGTFSLAGIPAKFELHVPGEHLALDAAAAIIVGLELLAEASDGKQAEMRDFLAIKSAIASFAGSRRRSEILGEAGGILFMDDYGHHPTAIRDTIQGIRQFWPGRRLVVDFMSHTYTRTQALFDDFARCLDEADVVFLHKIYSSARESQDSAITGKTLYEAVRSKRQAVFYFEEPMDAASTLLGFLKPGDIFLTMGAGDNWKLGAFLLDRLTKEAAKK